MSKIILGARSASIINYEDGYSLSLELRSQGATVEATSLTSPGHCVILGLYQDLDQAKDVMVDISWFLSNEMATLFQLALPKELEGDSE